MPIYPVTINPTPQGYDIGDWPSGSFGGYYNGAHYLFLHQYGQAVAGLGDLKVHAMKSTDGGVTWIEKDSANAVDIQTGPAYSAGTSFVPGYAMSKPDGDTILGVALVTHGIGGGLVLDGFIGFSFNLATDTWGAVSALQTSPVLNFYTPTISSAYCSINICVRGPGDYVFTFNGAFETVTGTQYGRVYVCSYDGATFGTPVMLPGQAGTAVSYLATKTLLDSSGRTHFFLMGSILTHVAMAPGTVGGTFGVVGTVLTAWDFFGDVGYVADPSIDIVSGVETLSIVTTVMDSGTGLRGISFYKAVVALNPTWTADPGVIITEDPTLVLTLGSNTVFIMQAAIAYLSGVYHCVFLTSENPFGSLYINGRVWRSTSSDGGATWSVPVLLWAAPDTAAGHTYFNSQQIYAYSWAGGVGIFASFNDPGDSIPDAGSNIGQFYAISPDLSITCGSPPNGTVGIAYTHNFSLTTVGGTPPDTWSIVSGALPNGITLNPSTGVISGSPTVPGTYTFTVRVEDSLSVVADTPSPCSITILGNVLIAGCNNPPSGQVGSPYSHLFTAVGGTPPYVFSTVSALPPGLALLPNGLLSGVPTTAGTFILTIHVVDHVGSTSDIDCSIVIFPSGIPTTEVSGFWAIVAASLDFATGVN